MNNPPIGSNHIIHELFSRYSVTQFKETKKNDDVDPESIPIIKQINVHLKMVRIEIFSTDEFKLQVF
jgi:hypothetical protein